MQEVSRRRSVKVDTGQRRSGSVDQREQRTLPLPCRDEPDAMAPARLDAARAARHDCGLAQLHRLRVQADAFEDLADVRREHRRLDGIYAGLSIRRE